MIRSEVLKTFPARFEELLSPYSAQEYSTAPQFAQRLLDRSAVAWTFYEDNTPLLVVGVVKEALLGTPYLWFLLCRGFDIRYLRRAKRFMRDLIRGYFGLQTHIEDEFITGLRFAEFFGFKRTEMTNEVLGRRYHVYEALP